MLKLKIIKSKNLVFIIIGSLVLLVIGYLLGSLTRPTVPVELPQAPLTELMESKVIRPITATAFGKVIKIYDRALTLEAEGDVFTIPIKEDALILRLIQLEETKGKPHQEITFEELKIGDLVEILAHLNADGSLEGRRVLVLP